MLPGFFFFNQRFWQIIFFIPIVGMLSWFVHGFVKNNTLTPTYILVLFIVSVLGLAWSLGTLLMYGKTKRSGAFVALGDLAFFGALIAGVVELRGIDNASCGNFGRTTNPNGIYLSLGPFGYEGVQSGNGYAHNLKKNCSMLKASFALGIIEVILFFFSFLICLWIRHHHRNDYRDEYRERGAPRTVYEERHVRRSGSRNRQGGSSYYTQSQAPPRGSQYQGSQYHGSRRSSHSRAIV